LDHIERIEDIRGQATGLGWLMSRPASIGSGRRPEWIKIKNPNYSRRDALRFGDERQAVPSALTTKSAGAR
jgi:hypothetical protein